MSLTDEDINTIKETFNNAVTRIKSEFYEMIEPFLKEVQASREEREIVAARLANHEDRIEVIERKLQD